jgi:hypothetical protein
MVFLKVIGSGTRGHGGLELPEHVCKMQRLVEMQGRYGVTNPLERGWFSPIGPHRFAQRHKRVVRLAQLDLSPFGVPTRSVMAMVDHSFQRVNHLERAGVLRQGLAHASSLVLLKYR